MAPDQEEKGTGARETGGFLWYVATRTSGCATNASLLDGQQLDGVFVWRVQMFRDA